MFADLSEILFLNEMPHKQLVMTLLYHLPGGLLLALGAMAVRMLIERIFTPISLGLARSRIWTWLVVIGWLIVVRTSSFTDDVARKIHWDALIAPPGQAEQKPPPPQQPGRYGRY